MRIAVAFIKQIVKTMQILHNHITTMMMMMIVMIMITVARLENQ